MQQRTIGMDGRRSPGAALVAGVMLALALLALALPRAASAGGWKECVDKATLEYNDCLMEGGSSFHLLLCDLDWEIEVAKCTAEVIGELRELIR